MYGSGGGWIGSPYEVASETSARILRASGDIDGDNRGSEAGELLVDRQYQLRFAAFHGRADVHWGLVDDA